LHKDTKYLDFELIYSGLDFNLYSVCSLAIVAVLEAEMIDIAQKNNRGVIMFTTC